VETVYTPAYYYTPYVAVPAVPVVEAIPAVPIVEYYPPAATCDYLAPAYVDDSTPRYEARPSYQVNDFFAQ
jgi:hypothetical protein